MADVERRSGARSAGASRSDDERAQRRRNSRKDELGPECVSSRLLALERRVERRERGAQPRSVDKGEQRDRLPEVPVGGMQLEGSSGLIRAHQGSSGLIGGTRLPKELFAVEIHPEVDGVEVDEGRGGVHLHSG